METVLIDPPKQSPSFPVQAGKSEAAIVPSPERETTTCRECGDEFGYEKPRGRFAAALALLQPQVCADCEPIADARHAAEVLAREKAERDMERETTWKTLVPPLYQQTEVGKLPPGIDGGVAAIAQWEFGPKGLGLCGASGRGKTRLMFLLCERMLKRDGRSLIYVSSADFSHRVSRLASQDVKDLDEYLGRLCRVSILFLDDLGKGRMTDRVESELYHVVEERTANLKPILFTANAGGDALTASMSEDRGEPIIRRLREFCNVVVL